jgi:hypothetical protein
MGHLATTDTHVLAQHSHETKVSGLNSGCQGIKPQNAKENSMDTMNLFYL